MPRAKGGPKRIKLTLSVQMRGRAMLIARQSASAAAA